MRIQFTVTDEELKILTKKSIEGNYPSISEYCKCISLQENTSEATMHTIEERERLGCLRDIEATHICRRDGGGGVGHVVPAGVRLDGHLDRS